MGLLKKIFKKSKKDKDTMGCNQSKDAGAAPAAHDALAAGKRPPTKPVVSSGE